MTTGTITALNSYPVKGLSAVPHDSVQITAGAGFPNDRVFGFAKGDSGFDPAAPAPLPKDRFLVLLQHEALAGLATEIDPETLRFSVVPKNGEPAQVFDLSTDEGAGAASTYFSELLNLPEQETPFFAQSQPHRFTDVSVVSPQMMHAISLLNLASIEELAEKAGTEIHPARFRGNVLIDGWPPFSELDLVGRQVRLGDITFDVVMRTRRCPATRVNPMTAERDLDVPGLIKQHYGHLDMGVYISARADGELQTGAVAEIL